MLSPLIIMIIGDEGRYNGNGEWCNFSPAEHTLLLRLRVNPKRENIVSAGAA